MAPSHARPSHKELNNRIRAARLILDSSGFMASAPQKLASDFQDLDLILGEEQLEALRAALQEICPEHYSGGRPPQKSYEVTTFDHEMFAFSWHSNYFEKPMYVKFCIQKGSDGEALYFFSLHEDRPTRKAQK